MQNNYDVLIIGAGAAGLMAAWELAHAGKKVAVLEARNRIGGRVHTATVPGFDLPVELGAEFVHGNLEPTLTLLQRAGIRYREMKGDIWQHKDGTLQQQDDFIEDYSALNKKFKSLEEDMSVAAFLDQYLQEEQYEELRFTLKNYVEGYDAADTRKASIAALMEDLSGSDEEQYRIDGGYGGLLGYLHEQAALKGADFFLSHPVQDITWEKGSVHLTSVEQSFHASQLLVTVSIGVLQSEHIRFIPALPQKTEAAKKLGFGPVIKTMLQFDEAFWKNRDLTQQKNLDKLGFIFSTAAIPTWWTHPEHAALLTGWSAGPNANEVQELGDEAIVQVALDSLSTIFSIDAAHLAKKLKGWKVANWPADRYSLGAYSYEVVGGAAARELLKQPVGNTVFFAGEGLMDGPEIGTVNAALVTGRDTARNMIALS